MISSLTVFWRERGVEGMGGKYRRGEGNGYPFPCLDVLQIKRGTDIYTPPLCLDVLKIEWEGEHDKHHIN